MRLSRLLVAAAILGSSLLAPRAASADTINFQGTGFGSTVSISGPYNGSVFAGQILWSWNSPVPQGFTQTFYSFCVELIQYVQTPTQTVSVGTTGALTGGLYVANAGDKAAWLFNKYGGVSTNTEAAALQVAIWEAIYDSSRDLNGGTFKLNTTGAIMTQANAYLTDLYNSSYLGSSQAVLLSAGGQDQITARVSEPSTLVLLGSGLLLIARRQRRRHA